MWFIRLPPANVLRYVRAGALCNDMPAFEGILAGSGCAPITEEMGGVLISMFPGVMIIFDLVLLGNELHIDRLWPERLHESQEAAYWL